MDSSRLIACNATALDKLQYYRKQNIGLLNERTIDIMIRGLKAFRTFLLCSTQLTEDSTDIPCSQKQMMMRQDNHRMKEELRSLLVGVEDVVRNILEDHIPYVSFYFQYDMQSWQEEMDNWYSSLSEYLEKYSTSPVANQIKATMDSVLENLNDYPSCGSGDDRQLKEQLEALKRNITVMRNIICFGTLLCTENQEFQCLLTHMEPLAVGAARITLRLFHVRGPKHLSKDVISSMVSALLLKINHAGNLLSHENYTLAVASFKHSQLLHDLTLDLNDYPFIVKMEHCIVSLLSTFYEMLQLVTRVSLKELQLCDRLKQLRTLLKRQPDRFDDDRIRDLTSATVFDAGVQIFSLSQKDLVSNQCLEDNIEVIWAEILDEKVVETSRYNFSKTNVLGFLDFLLEVYLKEVNSSNVDSAILSCVPKIREHLVFLKAFIGKLVELRRNQQENLHQDVWNLAVQVANKIEFLIDQLVLGDVLDSFSMSLQSITDNIMTIEADSSKIMNDEGRQEIFKAQEITWPSADKALSISSSDEVVGFQSEKASIVNRLLRGFEKLKVVAIVGMPGLGKTTLATKVYRDSSVTHHFSVKARCSISQVFDRKKVLLELLNQIQPGENYSTMQEDDLSQQLWRSLRKRRYIIFIDDIWDTKAFDLLKGSLPDDSNQSRILLTSRHSDVVLGDILDDKPLSLRHLTVDESLELLKRKLFPTQKDWPSELHEFGMEIAEYCKGLPLTVVIIAGILKTTEQEDWKDILKILRPSFISGLTDQCGSTIELSYTHLPDHLKSCFLWFGAFPEDHEFSVQGMIWLWISEGLVKKNESKSSEDVARDYLNNLIARSLVMNGERRSVGGVKTCRIHDLLHDFCKRKANEDFFLHVLEGDHGSREEGESSGEYETLLIDETENLYSVELINLRRLCIHSKPEHLKWKVFCPRLRSLLFFHPTAWDQTLDMSYIFSMFKLLRVLGIDEVQLTSFPSEIGALVQLRYLAIQVYECVGPAIGNLSNLETLILNTGGAVSLPDTLWNLQKLRHLYSMYGSIELPVDDSNNSCKLLELQHFSTLHVTDWSVLEKQLRKFPNIRQLRCRFDLNKRYMFDLNKDGCVNDSKVMDLSFLSQLESLSLDGFHSLDWVFPENMKKLNLRGTNNPWKKIASIAKLPYLEVLKLLYGAFYGDTWHVEEGEFSKLKFLRLDSLDVVNWTAASDDLFPNLEKLELLSCKDLEELPECLENVATLETIEVKYCTDDVVGLAKKVYEFHKEMGNSALQFHERGTFQKQKSGHGDEINDEQSSTVSEDFVTPYNFL